ncbi:hypothetical protein GMOD_00002629 [Pyrenophora seminiperda CCB06]|uniref:Uncharacterized protein n=1 Tax=Pyrenophora seminiperda CCB06 TaxID=1302712 RepID=A0A3M7M2S7_9PLEO|nr:hypothetical protein GMOD_00002629 [Pyrenophora seminiperda CCB06]
MCWETQIVHGCVVDSCTLPKSPPLECGGRLGRLTDHLFLVPPPLLRLLSPVLCFDSWVSHRVRLRRAHSWQICNVRSLLRPGVQSLGMSVVYAVENHCARTAKVSVVVKVVGGKRVFGKIQGALLSRTPRGESINSLIALTGSSMGKFAHIVIAS